MTAFTVRTNEAQPFAEAIKRAVIDLIEKAPSPMEREERIQIALDEGALTYAESYALRCGDDL